MPMFKLPFSGDVSQQISPFTSLFSPVGSQYGLINITIGQSSEPKVEGEALTDVASYGKQLGRIGDALIVLLKHFHPPTDLTEVEHKAIDDLYKMLDAIADVKDKHKRPCMRPHRR
ncbi:hypothetical protein [Beijerinckia sp. L45]|uniref:hypothetical protein n=1 Tax=Beijerinckia sp. L45 TaxID=1641855 RepID=UPI00131C27BB|nr:hypothetical protein [Beijerinckia sp. L45]